MNRPISDLPSVEDLGTWALGYWRDAPEITIHTNTDIHRFVGNEPDRNGVPYTFDFAYVLALYKAEQERTAREVFRDDGSLSEESIQRVRALHGEDI